ncbi:MAG: FeoB-associated Cys-rich membrane protein [Neisseria sp.]|nr:FeoB-associated Cys-rich membrane protein [Neisseria sp.]
MTQNIIVGIIVLLCAAYVLRKFVFKRKSDNICDGCGKCGGKSGGCH